MYTSNRRCASSVAASSSGLTDGLDAFDFKHRLTPLPEDPPIPTPTPSTSTSIISALVQDQDMQEPTIGSTKKKKERRKIEMLRSRERHLEGVRIA